MPDKINAVPGKGLTEVRKTGFLLAIIMLLSVFAGCDSAAKGGAVTIRVVTSFGSEDGNRQNFTDAYHAYELASGNKVDDASSAVNEEWKKQIQADFAAGSEPDVLFYFTGADADTFVKSGQVVPISDIRRQYPDYASNMKESMMPVSPADGRQYAVPVNGYWEGLFVNKSVLNACGVKVPGADYTWEQFLADCGTIRAKGYVPIACSLNEVPHYWFEFCIFNNGTISSHNLLPRSYGDTAGQNWQAGFEDIKLLYDRGFFPENTNTVTDAEVNKLMTDNKAAFMIDGSWKVGWFQSNAADINDFVVTYVPAKGERRTTDIIGGLSMGYYITKKAWDNPEKRAACVEFVTHMTGDDVVSRFASLSVTALKRGATPLDGADALVSSALAMTKGCTGIVSAVQDGLTPEARNALFADVKNIVTGAVSPAKAIESCLAVDAGGG